MEGQGAELPGEVRPTQSAKLKFIYISYNGHEADLESLRRPLNKKWNSNNSRYFTEVSYKNLYKMLWSPAIKAAPNAPII